MDILVALKDIYLDPDKKQTVKTTRTHLKSVLELLILLASNFPDQTRLCAKIRSSDKVENRQTSYLAGCSERSLGNNRSIRGWFSQNMQNSGACVLTPKASSADSSEFGSVGTSLSPCGQVNLPGDKKLKSVIVFMIRGNYVIGVDTKNRVPFFVAVAMTRVLLFCN